MKTIRYNTPLLIAALALTLLACNKEESKAKEPEKAENDTTGAKVVKSPTPDPAPKAEATKPEADPNADYVRILATHKDPKPSDPVVVNILDFKVTKSSFDPANLEGASAEIVLELPSLSSGDPKRDGHLKSADYLGVDKTPQVVIKISKVKKAGDGYEASAEVSAHGATKTMPVSFKVIKSDDTSVQIEASKEFDRSDFGISAGDDDGTAPLVKIEMRLTLKKS